MLVRLRVAVADDRWRLPAIQIRIFELKRMKVEKQKRHPRALNGSEIVVNRVGKEKLKKIVWIR